MASQKLVLPGETIWPDVLPIPSNPNLPLKLGPGLRHVPPSTITATIAGLLCIDQKKNAIWIESNGGRVRLSNDPQLLPKPRILIMNSVHTPTKRPHHRHRSSLLHRLLLLLHNASYTIRPTPATSLRRCHKEDPSSIELRQPDLRACPYSIKVYRSGNRMLQSVYW